MPRISCSQMTTYQWSFDEDVAGCQRAGIRGLGIWFRKLTEFGEERALDLLRESGLTVTSLSCAGGFTGSDGYTFCEAVSEALDAVRLAAELRAGCLVVVTGGRAGHTLNHASRLAVDAMRTLGDAGGELGVQIALLPALRTPAERWSFVTSVEATLKLLDRCRHPHVGMVCDVCHLVEKPVAGRRTAEVARHTKLATLCDPRLAAERLSVEPADLHQRLAETLRQFDECGYRGWYEAQLLHESCWRADYSKVLDNVRQGVESACAEIDAEPVLTDGPPLPAPATVPSV